MNKLFEEFVFELINKYKDDFKCEVKSQKGRKLLRGDHNKKRNTYVDIMVKKGNEKIVLDTKYKKFRNANDFSNADVFQVSTYCFLHNAHKAILLYPQWDNTRPNIDNYFLNTDEEITEKYEINFKTINLKHSDLKSNLTTIKDELAEILK